MPGELLLFAEVVLLAAAVPLAVVAALGFRGSPFEKVVVPIPFAVFFFLLADTTLLMWGPEPPDIYFPLSAAAGLISIYAAYNAMMLLSERRRVGQ